MLTRLLYRTLLKLSRKFEERPVTKAFVFSEQIRFDQSDDFSTESRLKDMKFPERALHSEIYEFCSPGVLYLPRKSIATSVKAAFRAEDFYGLDTTTRIDCAFLAIRYLSHVQKIAGELTQLPAHAEDSSSGSTISSVGDISERASASIVHVPELQTGSLLLSHPLWIPWPYNHSIILVWSYTEDHAIGLLLNKLYHVKFKEKLTKRERLRHTELKIFHDCPCFYGGNAENLTSLNFSIIHRKHELAGISEKIELPSGVKAASVMDMLHEHDASSPSSTGATAATAAASAAAASEEAQSSHQLDNVLYLTHNFEAVGAAISNGSISKHEIKVLLPCTTSTAI